MKTKAYWSVLVLVAAILVVTPVAAPPAASSAVEPPAGGLVASAPGFGWTEGEFSVSDDGAALYRVPLWMPDGRGAVAPELTLSYSGRGGNGPLGVGWSLSGLPSITACPRTMAQDGVVDRPHFDGTDVYCLGGTRLRPVSASGLPEREFRTEDEMFARIVAYGMQDGVPSHFAVWANDSRILTLGETEDSRLRSATGMIVSWAVNRIADRNGNASTMEYTHGNGPGWTHMRPSMIRYAPNRRIEFGYSARPDPVDGFSGDVRTRIPYRLTSVSMFAGSQGATAEKVREYQLSYTNTSITGRSQLTSVTEKDRDGTTKQPILFTYSQGGYDFDVIDTAIADVGTTQATGNRIIVADISGDGRDDLLYPDPDNDWLIRHSTGTGFGPALPAGIPKVDTTRRADIQVVDFDMDGRTDAVAEVPDASAGGTGWKLYRSNGTTFDAYVDNVGASSGPDDRSPDPIYFVDLDGNGLPDVLRAPDEYQLVDPIPPVPQLIDGPWSYRLNTGAAGSARFGPSRSADVPGPNGARGHFVVDTDGDGRTELIGWRYVGGERVGTYSIGLSASGTAEAMPVGVAIIDVQPEPGVADTGDFNGDGLEDSIAVSGFLHTRLSTGSGAAEGRTIQPSGGYTAPRLFEGTGGGFHFDRGVRIADFDGDGRQDVVLFRGGTPTGSGDSERGLQAYVWREPDGFARVPLNQFTNGWNDVNGFSWSQLLDVDGDSALDVVHVLGGHLRILKRHDGPPDRLIAVGDPAFRAGVEVDYTTLGDRAVHTPGTCTAPLMCLVSGGSVVAEHRLVDRSAVGVPDDVYRHRYIAGRVAMNGRGWLGFAQHNVTRAATGGTVTTTFDNVTYDADSKTYPYAHLPATVTETAADGTGREFRRTATNTYAVRSPGTGRYTVELRTSLEAEQERPTGGSWLALRSNTTEFTYDQFGNRTVVVSATTAGRRISDVVTYRNDAAAWLIGLPTRRLTTGCTAAAICTTRESILDYDGNGNRTIEVTEPNLPTRLTTTTQYGEFGTVRAITRTDSAGQSRSERFEYGTADLLYPTATVNAAGHRTLIETHPALGVPLKITDPNGFTATMRYDGFGRLRETTRSDGSFERIEHLFFLWHFTTTTDSAGASTTVGLDQLGRERERWAIGFDGRSAHVYTEYDALGRVRRISRPTFSASAAQYTTMVYDNRNRVLSVTAPDGAVVRHSYAGREAHTIDARNVERFTVETPDGDIAASYEDDPGSAAWLRTQFEYGPFGELTKAVAPDGTVQTTTYDSLGNPITHTDPSSGTTTWVYNAFGEVVSETDGTNTTTTFTHDALGRVTRETAPEGVTTRTWDTAAFGLGKLASATSADGVVTRHLYNDADQTVGTTYTVAGTAYDIAFGYDGLGRQSSLTYPALPGAADRLTVRYAYNQYGYLAQVADANTVYWTAEQRAADGQLVQERLGNGAVGTRNYDASTGLLTSTIVIGPGDAGALSVLAYGYDANRNVTGRADWLRGVGDAYTYDTLNRLTKWTARGEQVDVTASYVYDIAGNLRTQTVQGVTGQDATFGYGENGAPPHALTSRNGERYGYDGGGRQITGPQRSVTYNRTNLPRSIDRGQSGGRTDFRYDHTGARVAKTDAAQTVHYVPGLFERRTSTDSGRVTNVHHIMADGRVVAQLTLEQAVAGGPVTSSNLLYLHGDEQGSVVLETGPIGGVVRRLLYDPWGQRLDPDYTPAPVNRRPDRFGYVGREHDDELGLINMKGRLYDPKLRRFITPDPVIQNRLSGQNHNRYAYVLNNPATNTDPTGLIIDHGPYSAGPSRLGAAWLDYWHFNPLNPIPSPFDAPLILHAPDTSTLLHAGNGPSGTEESDPGETDSGESREGKTKGDALTIDAPVEDFEQIGKTYFWRVGNEYWYWLPSETEPTKSLSKAHWEHSKELARKGTPGYLPWDQYVAAWGALALKTPLEVTAAGACVAWAPCRAVAGDEALRFIGDRIFGSGDGPDWTISSLRNPFGRGGKFAPRSKSVQFTSGGTFQRRDQAIAAAHRDRENYRNANGGHSAHVRLESRPDEGHVHLDVFNRRGELLETKHYRYREP